MSFQTGEELRINLGLALRWLVLFLVGGLLLAYAVWPWTPLGRGPRTRTLVIYGFSILGEVMGQGIQPAFQQQWLQQTGEQVEFVTSFSASGTVTNQIIMGVPADIAILSLELDAWRLVEAGVLPGPEWRQLPSGGVLNRTPFIILVRPDNPKAIHSFADLARPGVGVVHPDPLTSGGAQWAILAEYGSAHLGTDFDKEAYDQLLAIWRNVVAQASSARGARTQFENGFGDALITYEQEALSDLARGRLTSLVVYPERTILSEHIVVPIRREIDKDEEDLAEAFLAFLWSRQAQSIFVEYGFRSVFDELNAANADFGTIPAPFTVDQLGGWLEARDRIVYDIWRDQVLPEVQP